MITPDTGRKIDAGFRSLRAAQSRGEAPPPGQITTRQMAQACGVSEDTINRLLRIALAKVKSRLDPDDLPDHLRSRANSFDLES